jgi:RNA polymerase sigma-70 factor (ECF subfamily)
MGVVAENTRSLEFEEHLAANMPVLYRAALHLTRNRADAQDLLQDVYVRALRFHHRYQPGTYIKPWLMTILRNTFINEYRRRGRRPAEVELSAVEHLPVEPPVPGLGFMPQEFPDTHPLECLSDATRAAMDELSDAHRGILVMADMKDMSYREIAEALDCPMGTVMSRLHRGRRLVRQALAAQQRAAR